MGCESTDLLPNPHETTSFQHRRFPHGAPVPEAVMRRAASGKARRYAPFVVWVKDNQIFQQKVMPPRCKMVYKTHVHEL